VISKLDSRSKGRGFNSHPILDENGFKAMPGWEPARIDCCSQSWLGHQMKIKKLQVAKWGTPKKIFKNQSSSTNSTKTTSPLYDSVPSSVPSF